MEETVSKVAGNMRVICLEVADQPGPQSLRAYIEKNSIALLSNYSCSSLDSPSTEWLGRNSSREKVRHSGLWNNNHVDESYDPNFLEILDDLVERRN